MITSERLQVLSVYNHHRGYKWSVVSLTTSSEATIELGYLRDFVTRNDCLGH